MSPVLADLFSGAGGAAAGYHAAGFEVIGFDIEPMPNYPYEHRVADALEVDLSGFDAVHASPPCQAFTKYRNTGNVGEYPDLIDATRQKFTEWGGPWVMENVEGAPLLDPILICGTMFDPPMEIQRHRLFESNWALSRPRGRAATSSTAPTATPVEGPRSTTATPAPSAAEPSRSARGASRSPSRRRRWGSVG